jgi:hypothetical protein
MVTEWSRSLAFAPVRQGTADLIAKMGPMWDEDLPQLGQQVREIVSGYLGVVVGQCEYLWGCHQVLVARAAEGVKPESEWFDVGRVEIIEPEKRLSPVNYPVAVAGADVPAPIR